MYKYIKISNVKKYMTLTVSVVFTSTTRKKHSSTICEFVGNWVRPGYQYRLDYEVYLLLFFVLHLRPSI